MRRSIWPAAACGSSIAAKLPPPAPVAQGIERCPAEAEVASSNLAGRMMRNPLTDFDGALLGCLIEQRSGC
jgi:hypothetical protein